MAVTITTGGTFPNGDAGQRPGLYVRFIERAIAAIGLGSRAKVATLKTVDDSEISGRVYRIRNMAEATKIFGPNTSDISFIFMGGAQEVVVGAINPTFDTEIFNALLSELETYEFHIFVMPQGSENTFETEAFTWMKLNRTNGKSFIGVFAADVEGTASATAAKARAFKDEASVFVANGVKNAVGEEIGAQEYAYYIAGLIAGTPIDGSLTYFEVPFAETITRFRTTDVQELLAAGCLVTVMDGDQPNIEQGLTLDGKIRLVRAKQAMVDDIDRAVNDNYIGKITNSEDGQIAVINAIKAYIETLAGANVVANDFLVELDKTVPSVGDEMYVNIYVRFLDSIEYVYLTITI